MAANSYGSDRTWRERLALWIAPSLNLHAEHIDRLRSEFQALKKDHRMLANQNRSLINRIRKGKA